MCSPSVGEQFLVHRFTSLGLDLAGLSDDKMKTTAFSVFSVNILVTRLIKTDKAQEKVDHQPLWLRVEELCLRHLWMHGLICRLLFYTIQWLSAATKILLL